MGTIANALDATNEATRHTKELTARMGDRNMPLMVQGYRGDQLLVLAQLEDVDGSDDILTVAGTLANGFEVDVLAVTSESWVAYDVIQSPLTGKPWGPGEMQDVVENHDGLARGWVTDGLASQVVNRAGDVAMSTLAYRQEGRKVTWLEERHLGMYPGDAPLMDGKVISTLRRIMLSPSSSVLEPEVSVAVASKRFGLSEERTLAHRDCAFAKIMMDPPGNWVKAGYPEGVMVALGAKPGTVRAEVIKRSLPNARTMRWDRNN